MKKDLVSTIWRYTIDSKTLTISKEKILIKESYLYLFNFYINYALTHFGKIEIQDEPHCFKEILNAYNLTNKKSSNNKASFQIIGTLENGRKIEFTCKQLNYLSGSFLSKNTSYVFSLYGDYENTILIKANEMLNKKISELNNKISDYKHRLEMILLIEDNL